MNALHVGGASTASVLVSVIVIFFLIFAFSFAFGSIPSGESRFSKEWIVAWSRATAPRLLGAALFSAALFLGSSMFGGGSGTPAGAAGCDRPVAPLTGEAVDDARILLASDVMLDMSQAAAEDRISDVQAMFFTGDAHNLTHDIDAYLRPVDADLARDLCQRVIVLENQMAGTLDAEVIERETAAIAAMLDEARPLISAAPSPSGSALDPCALPIGAVTSEPLSAERLTAVIETYEAVAADAATAPIDQLRATFGGDAHNLSHDIDGPLRQADEPLAIELCQSVLNIEREFANVAPSREVIAAESAATAETIAEAGSVLGILS